MSKFGDRLRALREDNDIKSKDFAKAMNVEASTVTNWEKGNRFPREDILIKIADYFNCSLDYLLARTDNPNAIVYSGKYNEQTVEFEIDKSYPHKLTPEDVTKMIKELEDVGFDVKTLIEKSKSK